MQLELRSPFWFEPSRLHWFFSAAAARRRRASVRQIASKRILITGLARNCAHRLRAHIRLLERLRSNFASSQVFIVENDSRDATKKMLSKWKAISSQVECDLRDTEMAATPLKGLSSERIVRMANCRNRYLDYLHCMPQLPDYVLVIDFDAVFIHWAGLIDALHDMEDWDALLANGLGFRRGGFFKAWRGYACYDSYALRSVELVNFTQTPEEMSAVRRNFSNLRAGQKPQKIGSAFGGAGLYQTRALLSLRYQAKANPDRDVPVLCEHVGLHQDMMASGSTRIAIHPSFLVAHSSPWETFCGKRR